MVIYHARQLVYKRITLNKDKAYETDKGSLNQKPLSRRSFHPDLTRP